MLRASILLLSGVFSAVVSLPGQQVGVYPALQDQTARAKEALRVQDEPGALKIYRAMIAADPLNSQAWTSLGILLYGSGQPAEAATALTEALRLSPRFPRAELFLSFSQADLQQCETAVPVLERYFEAEPQGKLQRLTGLTLLQCSTNSKDSATALKTAAQLKMNYPGDPDVLYELAELYTRLWTETANELITVRPESYRVHQLAAEVNEAQGNFGQAIRQYRAALGANSRLPRMHYRIGQLLLRAGDADADAQAMGEFRSELALHPQSAPAALAMGEIERHQGNLPEATERYTHALQLEPGLAEARVGLAQTLLAQHKIDAAEAQLRILIADRPAYAQAHYAMMLAYRQEGKLAEATAEMATFERLQKGSADQFQKKLDALLTGATKPPSTKTGASSNQ